MTWTTYVASDAGCNLCVIIARISRQQRVADELECHSSVFEHKAHSVLSSLSKVLKVHAVIILDTYKTVTVTGEIKLYIISVCRDVDV